MSLPSHPLRHHMTVTWRSCQRGYAWQNFWGDIAPVLGVILHFFDYIHEHCPQNCKVRHGYISYRVPWVFCSPISLWSCLQVPYACFVWGRYRKIWEIQVQLNVYSPSILICYFIIILSCSDWPVVQLCFLWPCGSCHNNSLCNEIAEVKLYLIWIRTNVVKVGTSVVAVFCFYVTSSTTCIINVSFLQQAFTVELKHN